MPPPTPVARIDHWIGVGSFIQAYRALLLGLEAAPSDDVLLAASSRLASALRSRGWSLGRARRPSSRKNCTRSRRFCAWSCA